MLLRLGAELNERAWRGPILQTSAATGEGVPELADKLAAHLASLKETGQLASRSGRQARSEMLALLHQALLERIAATVSADEWNRLIEAVVQRAKDPYTAAAELAPRVGPAHAAPAAA